ncbi:hypothetical protein VUR80DRAFT_8677 [Thermomyces stellatus]
MSKRSWSEWSTEVRGVAPASNRILALWTISLPLHVAWPKKREAPIEQVDGAGGTFQKGLVSCPPRHAIQTLQPGVMPRPDVAALGVNYSRIPVLSIGRDAYLDTRLLIRKLEALYHEKKCD